jgi:uncharacterized protein YbjT (DUF2867 family)
MEIKAIITGSTGMVGKGVLLECLENPEVEAVLLINRRPVGIQHKKIKEIIHQDFINLDSIRNELSGYNACFFCLGVTSVGKTEEDYRHITYDLTTNFASTVCGLNPGMTFCYVSGAGTDSSEKGRLMWARVKGRTENDILKLPFKNAVMFRPGFIQPVRGEKAVSAVVNILYSLFKPLYPLLKKIFPKYITSTENVGKAMINSVLHGSGKTHPGNDDINKLAENHV